MCSRSSIAADDTTAVQELTPNGSGAALLQITMQINYMVGVEDEVRNFSVLKDFTLKTIPSTLKLTNCNPCQSLKIVPILVSF